jgi:hypothetical protein
MKFQRPLLLLSNFAVIAPLVAHSYFGLFSRYLADDFCTSGQYKSQGFITSMQFWRLTWSGRYSFYFFMNVSHFIGEWITPYLTGIAIAIWLLHFVHFIPPVSTDYSYTKFFSSHALARIDCFIFHFGWRA